MCFLKKGLLAPTVAPDATKKKGLVVLEREFRPIIRQFVVAKVASPDEFIVCGALPRCPEGEVHSEHVLWVMGLRLNCQVVWLGGGARR